MDIKDLAAYMAQEKKQLPHKYSRRNDDNLATIMMRMLDVYGLKDKYNETRLKSLWEEIMGTATARQTQRIAVNYGVLYITVRSAALRQELMYHRETIKTRFNELLESNFVREVRLS
jgi:hypothetical protein